MEKITSILKKRYINTFSIFSMGVTKDKIALLQFISLFQLKINFNSNTNYFHMRIYQLKC